MSRIPQTPAAAHTTLDDGSFAPDNPLAEAQVILRQLALRNSEMTLGQLRRALAHVQEMIEGARNLVDSFGGSPRPAHWHDAVAGIRTMANEARATALAVEEGETTPINMAVTAFLESVDRSAAYLDNMLADVARDNGAERPNKRKKGEEPQSLFPRDQQGIQPARELPQRPEVPVPAALPVPHGRQQLHDSALRDQSLEVRDATLHGEATPYQVLKAQQILERLLPFLEQQPAAIAAEAHGLLFAWTTALWGRPILLVDTNDSEAFGAGIGAEAPAAPHRGEESPEQTLEGSSQTSATIAALEAPTQAFWAPSPRNMPQSESHDLARQHSHRRRRLHAALLDSPEDDNLDELD